MTSVTANDLAALWNAREAGRVRTPREWNGEEHTGWYSRGGAQDVRWNLAVIGMRHMVGPTGGFYRPVMSEVEQVAFKNGAELFNKQMFPGHSGRSAYWAKNQKPFGTKKYPYLGVHAEGQEATDVEAQRQCTHAAMATVEVNKLRELRGYAALEEVAIKTAKAFVQEAKTSMPPVTAGMLPLLAEWG